MPLKSFVLKYGGMAYRGEGAGSYQKVNSAPSSTSAANHASTASAAGNCALEVWNCGLRTAHSELTTDH